MLMPLMSSGRCSERHVDAFDELRTLLARAMALAATPPRGRCRDGAFLGEIMLIPSDASASSDMFVCPVGGHALCRPMADIVPMRRGVTRWMTPLTYAH